MAQFTEFQLLSTQRVMIDLSQVASFASRDKQSTSIFLTSGQEIAVSVSYEEVRDTLRASGLGVPADRKPHG